MEYTFGHCRPTELFQLVELANRVFRAQRNGDMGAEYPLVFEAPNAENLRVARYDGRIVAHVGLCIRDAHILGAPVRIASIGAVATDPDHRGHGLASRLMAEARAQAVADGASLMLISGGRGLYHRLGFVEVGLFHQYRVPAGAADPGIEVTEYQRDDLPALIALYQAEPVRFMRHISDWHKLVAAGMLMNQPADIRVIRHGNAIVGYAGVQRPRTGAEAARVREIAGSRSALAGALPAIAQEYEAAAAEVVTWSTDAEWRSQAMSRGWRWTPMSFPGTLGIIDPGQFFAAVRPLIAERLGSELKIEPAGEGARLSARGESVVLETMGQLTALVFGGETEEARCVPPLPEGVHEAVATAFPLPLLWYGYNYV